ncbi:MAG: hypothetical protein R3213_08385 [Flavobacteriaceae bacterium]|nr:hypothetical protein [Flavobacteriaceae bacterium]
MKKVKISISAFLLLTVLSCVSSRSSDSQNQIIGQPIDTPEAFLPPDGVEFDGNSCKSPMTDPQDGTRIIMVTAQGGYGNYRVPDGKYGISGRKLLRLDCSNGKVIGIVRD